MSKITISGLTKKYGEATVINNLDLDVKKGEFLTLLGPSGCGKTTTLRSIAGLETPDSGRITIGERVVTNLEEGILLPPNKRKLGMVFQSYAIWPHMTVFNNVAYPLKRQKLNAQETKRRVMNTLDSVGLAHAAARLATQLSGGQQQRVALARAIVGDPSVLLFDEPLSNLDAQLRLSMRDEIMRLRSADRTSVYVTHDQSEAFALSDRIAVMFDGKIAQLDTAQKIVERPVNLDVARFLGIENLLTGTIQQLGSKDLLIDVAGLACSLKVNKEVGGTAVGAQVTLAIRASNVGVSKTAAKENACKGNIVQATFLGDGFQYRVSVGSVQVLSRQPLGDGPVFGAGDSVFLELPADKISVFVAAK